MEYKYSEITGEIINTAMEIHRILSNGFQEVIYQRAFEMEVLERKRLTISREFEMPIYYKDKLIGKRRVDFLVNNLISVEFKAVSKIEDIHFAQALNYLEIYNLEIGLLINFGARSLEYKRLFNKKYKSLPKQQT